MMTFEVRRMSLPEDLPKMEDFLFKQFLPDVPLVQVFNVDTNPDLPDRLPLPYQPSPNTQDFYLKAIDSSGQIIGIAVNKEHPVFTSDSNTSKEWLQMMEFFEFTAKQSHIDSLPGKTIELFILAVHRDWRKNGVARKLAEESMMLARAAGFTTMKTCCANEYTAILARSLGCREYYRIPYKDYSKLSGANVSLTAIPYNENMYIYVTELK